MKLINKISFYSFLTLCAFVPGSASGQTPATLATSSARDRTTCRVRVFTADRHGHLSLDRRNVMPPFILRLENGVHLAYRFIAAAEGEPAHYEQLPFEPNNLQIETTSIDGTPVRQLMSDHPLYRAENSAEPTAAAARVSPSNPSIVQVLTPRDARHNAHQFRDELLFEGNCPRDLLSVVQRYPSSLASILRTPERADRPDRSGVISNNKPQVPTSTRANNSTPPRRPAPPVRRYPNLDRFQETGANSYYRRGSFKPGSDGTGAD